MTKPAATVLAVTLLLPAVAFATGPARMHCGVEMRNVALRVADDIVLQVRTLDGEFVSRLRARPPIFDDPNSRFEEEEIFDAGDRVVQRWRYSFEGGHIRGVDLFRVQDGKVAEKLSYVKG